MTDRIRSVRVILDDDYRTDDVEAVTAALGMVRGVAEVRKGEPVDPHDHEARAAALHEVTLMIYALLGAARDGGDTWQKVKLLLAEDWRKRTGGKLF